MTENNFGGKNYQAGRLPIVQIGRKHYYKDERLQEYRNVRMFASIKGFESSITFSKAKELGLKIKELPSEEQIRILAKSLS